MRIIMNEILNKEKVNEILNKLSNEGKLPTYCTINEMGLWEIESNRIDEFKNKYL